MTKHQIVAALKQFAQDLGHVPSRTEFRDQCTTVTEHQIRMAWAKDGKDGSFSDAMLAAGFSPGGFGTKKEKTTPAERKFNNDLRKQDHKEILLKRFNEEILPWVGKYERDPKKVITLMIRTDDHAQYVDQFCDEVFWEVAKRLQPSHVVFGGDNSDFWEVSFHSKNPKRQMTLQSEIDFVEKNFFARAREVCPDAQIDWLLGNHEWRLFRYLSDVAPALSSLRCLRFDDLFHLKDYEINLVARESFLNARKSGTDIENYKIYGDCFAVTHGTRAGVNPAQKELKDVWGHSGSSGHVHRHTVHTWRNLYGYHKWQSAGAMCSLKAGDDYIPDLINWTQGFMIVHIIGGQHFTEYVDCSNDFVCVGGVYYFRKKVNARRVPEKGSELDRI